MLASYLSSMFSKILPALILAKWICRRQAAIRIKDSRYNQEIKNGDAKAKHQLGLYYQMVMGSQHRFR
jgi:hypothetical protein